MRDYLISVTAFSALALLLRFVCTRWYRHLLRLSERYDLPERRRIAGRRSIIVSIVLVAASASTLLPLIRYTSVPSFAITIGFLLAVAPNLIWWLRRVSTLEALGYGGTSSR